MPLQDYDVLVVGARVAGATVAALLGDADYRVLLVDRATFPSPTLSTHFFRGNKAVSVFQRLGVLERLLSLGAPPLVRQYSYPDGSRQPEIEPPQDPGKIGYALSVRRGPLDHILVQRATSASSVDLSERTRVTELLWEHGRVVGARLATPTGEQTVRTRIVIGADGRHSFVARAVNAPIEESDPPFRGIYYRYVRGFPGPDGRSPDGPEFSWIGDEIAYIFPSDDAVTCIALSINLADYARIRQSPRARFAERIARHEGLAGRFATTTPEGPLLGCGPEPSYMRVPVGPGWALVGDAGLHQDPWSGNGIDMAATHATFLTDAIQAWFSNATSEADALATYHQRRNESGLETYRGTVEEVRKPRQNGEIQAL